MPDWIDTWLFWTQPRRRWLVRLAVSTRAPRRLRDWLTDRLIPDEAVAGFPVDSEARS